MKENVLITALIYFIMTLAILISDPIKLNFLPNLKRYTALIQAITLVMIVCLLALIQKYLKNLL